MGFVSTGSTININAFLTQKGREYLISNKENFKITFFSFGDSDANYNVIKKIEEGYVPDLSGDNWDCVKSLADNVNIKNKIIK